MRRFAMDKLLDWKKKSNRKPLILMGARQVGKTWLMKEFGKTYYEKTAYISFYNNQRMQAVFDTDFDIKRIIMNLNIESGVGQFGGMPCTGENDHPAVGFGFGSLHDWHWNL